MGTQDGLLLVMTGVSWVFRVCGTVFLGYTLYAWWKLPKLEPGWRLSWKQALRDLTFPCIGFAGAVMVLTDETLEVAVSTATFFLFSFLAIHFAERKELSVFRLSRDNR